MQMSESDNVSSEQTSQECNISSTEDDDLMFSVDVISELSPSEQVHK